MVSVRVNSSIRERLRCFSAISRKGRQQVAVLHTGGAGGDAGKAAQASVHVREHIPPASVRLRARPSSAGCARAASPSLRPTPGRSGTRADKSRNGRNWQRLPPSPALVDRAILPESSGAWHWSFWHCGVWHYVVNRTLPLVWRASRYSWAPLASSRGNVRSMRNSSLPLRDPV